MSSWLTYSYTKYISRTKNFVHNVVTSICRRYGNITLLLHSSSRNECHVYIMYVCIWWHVVTVIHKLTVGTMGTVGTVGETFVISDWQTETFETICFFHFILRATCQDCHREPLLDLCWSFSAFLRFWWVHPINAPCKPFYNVILRPHRLFWWTSLQALFLGLLSDSRQDLWRLF